MEGSFDSNKIGKGGSRVDETLKLSILAPNFDITFVFFGTFYQKIPNTKLFGEVDKELCVFKVWNFNVKFVCKCSNKNCNVVRFFLSIT